MVKYRPAEGSTQHARALRNDPTDAEKRMWRLLRGSFPEWRWRRQVPLRHYVVDVARHAARLVIECDGGQHTSEGDAARTQLIEAEGYRVLRFWNHEVVDNPDGVHSAIARALMVSPHPNPSPSRGGA